MPSVFSPNKVAQLIGLTAAAFTLNAQAIEYPIGAPQQRFGMEIGAVYLQPVVMEPEGMMKKAEESDVHIEADIKALAGNPNGFEEGSWIPYLIVKFEVTKAGTTQSVKGPAQARLRCGVARACSRRLVEDLSLAGLHTCRGPRARRRPHRHTAAAGSF